jgi:hypothetical protein
MYRLIKSLGKNSMYNSFKKYLGINLEKIYLYVHTLFGPFVPHVPISFPHNPLASRKNLFCPLLQFCWREDISENKKDIAFLLI